MRGYAHAMDASVNDATPARPATPCSLGCRYAEPVRGDYPDWIWCNHPRATSRMKSTASECPRFESGFGRERPER